MGSSQEQPEEDWGAMGLGYGFGCKVGSVVLPGRAQGPSVRSLGAAGAGGWPRVPPCRGTSLTVPPLCWRRAAPRRAGRRGPGCGASGRCWPCCCTSSRPTRGCCRRRRAPGRSSRWVSPSRVPPQSPAAPALTPLTPQELYLLIMKDTSLYHELEDEIIKLHQLVETVELK